MSSKTETAPVLMAKPEEENQLSPNPAGFGFTKMLFVDSLPVGGELKTLYALKVKKDGEVIGYSYFVWDSQSGFTYAPFAGSVPNMKVADGGRSKVARTENAPKEAPEKVFYGLVVFQKEPMIKGLPLSEYIDKTGGVTHAELEAAIAGVSHVSVTEGTGDDVGFVDTIKIDDNESLEVVTPSKVVPSIKGADIPDGAVIKVLAVDSDGNLVKATAPSGTVTVDGALSDESENPVQNKVITAELEEKADKTYVNAQDQRNSQNIAKRSAYNSHFVQTLRPLVTIIDDDGSNAVLTTLKSITEDYNIPVGIALKGTSAVVVDDVKRAELLNLQNTKNWEILSHTMTHTNLSDMTSQEIEDDCKLFIETFNEYGFNVFNFVYPFSKPNDNASKIISKYYSAGFGTRSNYNTQENIDEYDIYRVNIGAVYEGTPTKTLQEYKDIVDLVKANNGWLVLMTHIGDTDSDGVQMIRDVLDYVVLQNIEIVTPTEGLRVFGSVTQSGLKSENHFHIKSNGIVDTNTYAMIERVSKLETDPPLTNNSVSSISYFKVNDWSLGNGLVFEYVGPNGYQYQEFRKSGTDAKTYVRKWSGTQWRMWYRNALTLDKFDLTVTARTIPANSCETITTFESSALSSYAYNAQPTGQLEDGIIWSCWSYGDGAYRLRLCNPTNSAVVLDERIWKIHILA